MAAFSVKKGLLLAAWVSVLYIPLGSGFELGIPWGKKDHNNSVPANAQEAPSLVSNHSAQASRNNFGERRVSDEDRERVDTVVAQLVNSLGNGTKAADSTREAATEFCRLFFDMGFSSSHRNYNAPNGDRLRLSATRAKEHRKEEHGGESNIPDADALHKDWGGGQNSDTGLLSVKLSDGDAVFLSGTVVPPKCRALSYLRRLYASAENGVRSAAYSFIRKGDGDIQTTSSPVAVRGERVFREDLVDEDRDRVDPLIALLANHLSHNTEDAESAKEKVAGFYHDIFYGSKSKRVGRNMTLPNGDSLRVSATWHQKDDREGREDTELQGGEPRGRAEAEAFHEGWGGGRDSDTGLINILLSDGDIVLLSGRVVPAKRAWARLAPAKGAAWARVAEWLPWLPVLAEVCYAIDAVRRLLGWYR